MSIWMNWIHQTTCGWPSRLMWESWELWITKHLSSETTSSLWNAHNIPPTSSLRTARSQQLAIQTASAASPSPFSCLELYSSLLAIGSCNACRLSALCSSHLLPTAILCALTMTMTSCSLLPSRSLTLWKGIDRLMSWTWTMSFQEMVPCIASATKRSWKVEEPVLILTP